MPGRADDADARIMERRVIWICATVGGVVGSLVPGLLGGSGMSLAAIAFSALGSVAGVLLGARLSGT